MSKLEAPNPLLMVPIRYTFSVIVYNDGIAPQFPTAAIRDAIIQNTPPGTGVGQVSCINHGVVMLKEAS